MDHVKKKKKKEEKSAKKKAKLKGKKADQKANGKKVNCADVIVYCRFVFLFMGLLVTAFSAYLTITTLKPSEDVPRLFKPDSPLEKGRDILTESAFHQLESGNIATSIGNSSLAA